MQSNDYHLSLWTPHSHAQHLQLARYYDPEGVIFNQPDWLDPDIPGVGMNRHSYSFNDPVNLSDPSRNGALFQDIDGDGLNELVGQTGWDGNSFTPEEGIGFFSTDSGKIAAFSFDLGIVGGTFADRRIADLGLGSDPNIVGFNVHSDGSFDIITQNSPRTAHRIVDGVVSSSIVLAADNSSTLGGNDPAMGGPAAIRELEQRLRDPSLTQKERSKLKNRLKELRRSTSKKSTRRR